LCPLTEIRRLSASRWKDYRRIRLESLQRNPLAFGSAYEEEARFGEGEWRKRMKNVHFAITDGVPVGTIVCSFNNDAKFKHIAEIYGYYVRPGYRGKGVGTALLDHALHLAKSNSQILKVRLYVNSKQRVALSMYEKAGFVVVGRLSGEMNVGTRFYTMLVMEKRVR
jgi:ribosomal protein S18 acetylase RimI-like enzyme